MKQKIKTNLELMKEVRKTWHINPLTRIHDNDIKRNKKKLRQVNRVKCRKELVEYNPPALLIFILQK